MIFAHLVRCDASSGSMVRATVCWVPRVQVDHLELRLIDTDEPSGAKD